MSLNSKYIQWSICENCIYEALTRSSVRFNGIFTKPLMHTVKGMRNELGAWQVLKMGKGNHPKLMRHRGFWPWGIQIGPFADFAAFVQIIIHRFCPSLDSHKKPLLCISCLQKGPFKGPVRLLPSDSESSVTLLLSLSLSLSLFVWSIFPASASSAYRPGSLCTLYTSGLWVVTMFPDGKNDIIYD